MLYLWQYIILYLILNNIDSDDAKQAWVIILNLKDLIATNNLDGFQVEFEKFYKYLNNVYYGKFGPHGQDCILDAYIDQYKKFNIPVTTFDILKY